MKPSAKKKLTGLVIPIVWLVACYFIGQHVNMPGRSVPVGAEPSVAEVTAVPPDTVASHGYTVTFHDVQAVDTDQIPWGFTAGEIELEDGTSALLLTPGTYVTLKGATEIEYSIHPWMAQISDGALLLISDSVDERQLEVTAGWNRVALSGGACTVSLVATENQDGDWIILKAEAAEEG